MLSLKTIKDFTFILLGTAIFGFTVIFFNIPNDLAEGGITGITLIARSLFGINPAITTLLFNIPLILIGRKHLGIRSFYYTILGTFGLSFWLAFWQSVPIKIDLNHDLLIASLLGGLIAGFGVGLVYKVGGTTGGSDIVARIVEKYFGVSVGRSLFVFDVIVLTASLTYISLVQMMYTLIYAYVFSKVIDSIIDGGYSAKGIYVLSNRNTEIAPVLMTELQRGVTYLDGEGAYSRQEKKMIFMVLTPQEVPEAKRIIHEFDPSAFISIINVHEALGEGFGHFQPEKRLFKRTKKQRP
ncbi:YitT family protein [Enterococcus alcedinis]|uniref:YitT family protein n=1 Tax=Enterococcus alcedinis TaxID=1274384 RepID=UPI0016672951|nr:YitT family protein [Enterococcus alcedinis]